MDTFTMASIEYNVENHIGLLTVNRPHVRNAMNWEAIDSFAAAMQQAHADPDLQVLIITGAGNTFISGGDLNELHGYNTEEDARRLNTIMGDALNQLSDLPCITIAAMERATRGGGGEVALACDWRVAAEDSNIGFVQIRLGITTGWGGATRLAQVIGYARALDLLALGRVIGAIQAYHLGLVTHLAPPGEALQSAQRLAETLMEYDPNAVRAYKRILKAHSFTESQQIERDEFPGLWVSEAHHKAVEKFLRS